ncbi:MAG TPA: DUF2247 family protein [Ignavibacteriales bacterium]|nr:DUF2247 family protein [Ignavibacteriales bacterium]
MQESGNLSLLESIGIKPDYMDLYVGLEKGWMHERKLYDYLNRYEDKANEDLIVNIYVAENEGKDSILKNLRALTDRVYSEENFKENYNQSKRKWILAFLFSIYTSNETEKEKNDEILKLEVKIFQSPSADTEFTKAYYDWDEFIEYPWAGDGKHDGVNFEKLTEYLIKHEKELPLEYINKGFKKVSK